MPRDRKPDLSGIKRIPRGNLEQMQFQLAPPCENYPTDLDTEFDRRQVGLQVAMVEDLIQDWQKNAPD